MESDEGHWRVKRPRPPQDLFADVRTQFIPAPELIDWARRTFIEPDASLHNPEHEHLNHAYIGALWTNVPNGRHGRQILGMCETGTPNVMGKWQKARAEMQIEQWFGSIPDFIITLDAQYAETCSDVKFCALVEHELLHAAQERDEFGAPKFSRSTGRPKFAMRGHDIEEFTSIVRRYGAEAAHAQAFIDAAKKGPEIGPASIAHACGVCLAKAA